MSDDSTISSADDSQETAHRQRKDQYGTEDLPIAPAPQPDPGNPIAPPGGPDPLDPKAPKPPPDQLNEAGFSVVPGQPRVVGPPRPKHQAKSKSESRVGHHSGARVFSGKDGVERFSEHLQESVADDQTNAALALGDAAEQAAGAGSVSGELPVATEPQEPPFDPDLPPAWTPLPLPPQPKPPRAKKPPPAPKPPQGSIEGSPRLRPVPLAVPQPAPQPEDVGDFSDDAGQSGGDRIGGDGTGTAAQPAGGSYASGTSSVSSASDPMRDARDLIVAFREAIEKLSQAADKLAQGGGRGDVDRLDVA
jgi:hypothetical protein